MATKANVRAMTTSSLLVERNAKRILGTGASRTDVKLRRSGKGKRKKFHRPSAPGFPPAVDTGVMRASINHVVIEGPVSVNGFVGSDKDRIQQNPKTRTGTDLNYPFYLEIGTVHIEARPWLRPALRKSEKDILKIFRKANS